MALTWMNLGTVEPRPDEWRIFPQQSFFDNLFRVSFTVGDWERWNKYIRGWVYLRWSYQFGTDGAVSPIRKVWVQPEPQVIELPLPQKLVDEGVAVRDFYAMRRSSRRWGRIYADVTTISVTLESAQN